MARYREDQGVYYLKQGLCRYGKRLVVVPGALDSTRPALYRIGVPPDYAHLASPPRLGASGDVEVPAYDSLRIEQDDFDYEYVLPEQQEAHEDYPEYGYVCGGLPMPADGACYMVEFLSEESFRIWGYADRFGRIFVTCSTLEAPPARNADLMLSITQERGSGQDPSEELGCIELRSASGVRTVASYRRRCTRFGSDGFDFFDTWYDFGEHSRNQEFFAALTRCFFAFVFRPILGWSEVPEQGYDIVASRLRKHSPAAAIGGILDDVNRFDNDGAIKLPQLDRLLKDWLCDADPMGQVLAFTDGDEEADPLRIVRTKRYADTYYVAPSVVSDEPIDEATAWKIESALNRYLLISEAMGDGVWDSSAGQCGIADNLLFTHITDQARDAAHPVDEARPASRRAREWDLRRHIGEQVERLRLPVRCLADYRVDLSRGVVAFELTVPGVGILPNVRFDEAAVTWRRCSVAELRAQALEYAQRLGYLVAALAFNGSASVRRVLVCARPLSVADKGIFSHFDSVDGLVKAARGFGAMRAIDEAFFQVELLGCDDECLYWVNFDRKTFVAAGDVAQKNKLTNLFVTSKARYGSDALAMPSVFGAAEPEPLLNLRQCLPEDGKIPAALDAHALKAFGIGSANEQYDLRILANGGLRGIGVRLARQVSGAHSATEAVHAVLAEQKQTKDPRVYEACTRLMTGLTEGRLDVRDENDIVAEFMGPDEYMQALRRSRAVGKDDPGKAAAILRATLVEAEESGRYADNSEVVHRAFDSYASRIIYNRERQGTALWPAPMNLDAGKRVELLPNSLALCYLDSVRLLEHSFSSADEALDLGRRCIQVAPTYSPAYRQMARAYMLVGDMESASKTLKRCLQVALDPDEIALAYYQLGYVEWKSGRAEIGAACYTKSMMTSGIYLGQCSIELHELLEESKISPVPAERVDAFLEESLVPVAPAPAMLDALDDAIHAAVDVNMFQVADELLEERLKYRPDDALVNVRKSLGLE